MEIVAPISTKEVLCHIPQTVVIEKLKMSDQQYNAPAAGWDANSATLEHATEKPVENEAGKLFIGNLSYAVSELSRRVL